VEDAEHAAQETLTGGIGDQGPGIRLGERREAGPPANPTSDTLAMNRATRPIGPNGDVPAPMSALDNGWRAIALGGFEVIELPGSLGNILDEPRVGDVEWCIEEGVQAIA
jgi:hypothetical protein